MDVQLFKGEVFSQEISLGLLKKQNTLAFKKGKKYLVARTEEKEIIKLPETVDFDKIKKNGKMLKEVLEHYLTNDKIEGTSFYQLLSAYYLYEISAGEELLEPLDDEGKKFLSPLVKNLLQKKYVKEASFRINYFKESQVIASYGLLDLPLILNDLFHSIDKMLFNGEEARAVYPLRFSKRTLEEKDVQRLTEIFKEKFVEWMNWRNILREDKLFYSYIVNWIYTILDQLYPVDEETVQFLTKEAITAELTSNATMIGALQTMDDIKVKNLDDLTYNKFLLYDLSYEMLMGGRTIIFEDYETVSLGYHDLFNSMANNYTSMPIFNALNPPSEFVASSLYEWITKDLSFEALRGNQQLDPYKIVPNVLGLVIAITGKYAKKIPERKYIIAQMLKRILKGEKLKQAIIWQKRTNMAMQGKDSSNMNLELTDKELEEKQKEITDKLETIINELELEEEQINALEAKIEQLNIIEETYEEIRAKKDELVNISNEHKEIVNDFQKDFLLTVQLVEKDNEILDQLAQLFNFFDEFRMFAGPNSIGNMAKQMWMISLVNKGTLDWLKMTNDGEQLDTKEEADIYSRVCLKNNTAIKGYVIKGRPLIETTAPPIVLQLTENLSELLVTKDLEKEKEYGLYTQLFKQLDKIYPTNKN